MAFNSAERSRAARLRSKRRAGRSLSNKDRLWFDRYEAVKRAGTKKKGTASKRDRDRAYRLRKRRRAGHTLRKADDSWLRRYTRDRRLNKSSTAKAAPSTTARTDAERIVRAIADWITPGMTAQAPITTEWQRKPTLSKPGIAIAEISIDDHIVPATLTERDLTRDTLTMPPATGRKVAMRILIADEEREPAWVSVTARDADWYETAGDILNAMNRIMTAYQVQGVSGWSAIVS